MSTGPGLLKAELRAADSLVMRAAEKFRIPAGAAFAVDRERFSAEITQTLESHPNIEIRREEILDWTKAADSNPVLVATGPLTSDGLFETIRRKVGSRECAFFDAIAPRVMAESVDFSKGFWASRYDKGDGSDYFNCPMTKEEYLTFFSALKDAETVKPHVPGEEKIRFFEGCLPVEEMARRGPETLVHGPLKPVGLSSGKRLRGEFYAVVQLRKDNREGTVLGMVGFQTCLTYPEQKRIFRLIPALRNAAFAQLGSIHLNRYIRGPSCLDATLRLLSSPNVFFAGQISGVEGYIESCATGFAAALHIVRLLSGLPPAPFPPETAIGALCRYVSDPSRVLNFQPQNINFGILGGDPRLPREKRSARALEILSDFMESADPHGRGKCRGRPWRTGAADPRHLAAAR